MIGTPVVEGILYIPQAVANSSEGVRRHTSMFPYEFTFGVPSSEANVIITG